MLMRDYRAVAETAQPMCRIRGKVAHGRKLGRTLGFPTANLPLGSTAQSLQFGVYSVRVWLPDGRLLDGVASAGINPTVGRVAPVLEVFIFDFSEDLYGKSLSVELWAYIREERDFASLDELVAQIHRDVEVARRQLQCNIKVARRLCLEEE
jgi:riboflavin kinase/FMN adenylyltransferase